MQAQRSNSYSFFVTFDCGHFVVGVMWTEPDGVAPSASPSYFVTASYNYRDRSLPELRPPSEFTLQNAHQVLQLMAVFASADGRISHLLRMATPAAQPGGPMEHGLARETVGSVVP